MRMKTGRRFRGRMGDEYNLIRRIIPHFDSIQSQVGDTIARFKRPAPRVLELGCGDGITTSVILEARPDATLLAIDNEPKMIAKAKRNLGAEIRRGRCVIRCVDALACLSKLPGGSVDVAASAMTLHNFTAAYRHQVLRQIHRILAAGGLFVNGDKYAPQDECARFSGLGLALQRFFDTLVPLRKYKLLEEWVLHHVADQGPERVMREQDAVAELKRLGFIRVSLGHRNSMEALMVATRA